MASIAFFSSGILIKEQREEETIMKPYDPSEKSVLPIRRNPGLLSPIPAEIAAPCARDLLKPAWH